MKTVNIGGDRLGSGNKMNVALRNYERSTHDLSYVWRSSMAPGTLVPFLKQVALPGDTFDINLDAMIKTIPTLGPLFGSFKFQLDIFQVPFRLYIKELHNNKLGIGLDMSNIVFPYINMKAKNPINHINTVPSPDLSNFQINQSSLFAYLGVRSVGYNPDKTAEFVERRINALPFIAYYDIYKNYYANKQEEIGFVITPSFGTVNPFDSVIASALNIDIKKTPLNPKLLLVLLGDIIVNLNTKIPDSIKDNIGDYILLPIDSDNTNTFEHIPLSDLYTDIEWINETSFKCPVANLDPLYFGTAYFEGTAGTLPITGLYNGLNLQQFDLNTIDTLREALLTTSPMEITNLPVSYAYAWNSSDDTNANFSQSGLAIKTYQSDIFNNWISTEWLDGENGINAITAVDTSEGYFTIDQLNLSKKVYDMLNRIAVSGGTYQDWLEVSYDIDTYFKAETPIYCGGLSKEVIFTEVISTAENEENPLGTLAGKGTFSDKHKGGYVVVKVDEPCYIIGIASLTPRIDYSQGNDWDISLNNMGQLHVPALDGIGFQDLMAEQLHGIMWNTDTQSSPAIGKQPAWINYMTNYNRVYGTFAEPDNQMFMTLNRRYTTSIYTDTNNPDKFVVSILDPTTYIDPTKYNYAFADTALDAQNFWVQIGVGIEARRKMSAKQIPNL
ncbi:MAG: major capsid protein [Sulfolobaceae archaeon]